MKTEWEDLDSNALKDKSLLYVYRLKMTEMGTTLCFFFLNWYKFSTIPIPEANYFLSLFIYLFGHAPWHVGSWFPD